MADMDFLEFLDIDPDVIESFGKTCIEALETAGFTPEEIELVKSKTRDDVQSLVTNGCGQQYTLTEAVLHQLGYETTMAFYVRFPDEAIDYRVNDEGNFLVVNSEEYFEGDIKQHFNSWYTDNDNELSFDERHEDVLILSSAPDGGNTVRFELELSAHNLETAMHRGDFDECVIDAVMDYARDGNSDVETNVIVHLYRQNHDFSMVLMVSLDDNGEKWDYNANILLTENEKTALRELTQADYNKNQPSHNKETVER